jgi:Uncharacterized conserved protein (DUF2183)
MSAIRNSSRRWATVLALSLVACATDDVEDLGTIADGKSDTMLPRTVELELEPGESKRFRITTAAFVASIAQLDDVDAQLTAKHYSYSFASDVSAAPTLQAAADGTVRNWSLTVFNRGGATLDATLVVDVPRASGELGIVSDIDKTVMPPETAAGMPPPYPGVASLLTQFEGAVPGDFWFVTAREPARVVDVPDWMAMHGIPPGPIETGLGGQPWVVQPEKVADISRIFDATGDQSFVLIGDTSQRDPEVYKAIKALYPARVSAIFIHKMNATVNPTRVDGMYLINNYAEAAAISFGLGLMTEAEARAVMTEALTEGLAITTTEIDALIDANR